MRNCGIFKIDGGDRNVTSVELDIGAVSVVPEITNRSRRLQCEGRRLS